MGIFRKFIKKNTKNPNGMNYGDLGDFAKNEDVLKELIKNAVCDCTEIIKEKYAEQTICGLAFEINGVVSGIIRENDLFRQIVVYVMTKELLSEKLTDDPENEWYYKGNAWGEYDPVPIETKSTEALREFLIKNYMDFNRYEQYDDTYERYQSMAQLETMQCEVLGELIKNDFFDGIMVIPFAGEDADRENHIRLFRLINGGNFSDYLEHLDDFL